jgi:two-component system cell cycle sensor histidine kinase/response regulator CckA
LVMVDPGQLEQVLVNLALNARDAMPHGGRLSIGTQNVTYDSANVDAARIIPPGDYVVVEVRDTGVGMDAQTRTRLFEPFFTTKAPGKGTGLGLATVYGIVKQSAGYILVESALDEGTTFCVYLPRTSTDKSQEDQQAAASLIARGVETVLLIEDEAGVLEVATRVLKRQGYQVLQAQDGFQALSIASTFDAPIHLVLSDAAMPGLSGAETCRRLLALRPNLKVVMMSGYTDDEVLRRGVVLSDVVFMEKPFTAATLVRVVRQALDG